MEDSGSLQDSPQQQQIERRKTAAIAPPTPPSIEAGYAFGSELVLALRHGWDPFREQIPSVPCTNGKGSAFYQKMPELLPNQGTEDVAHANESIETVLAEQAALQAELNAEIARIHQQTSAPNPTFPTLEIRAPRTRISLRLFTPAWL